MESYELEFFNLLIIFFLKNSIFKNSKLQSLKNNKLRKFVIIFFIIQFSYKN